MKQAEEDYSRKSSGWDNCYDFSVLDRAHWWETPKKEEEKDVPDEPMDRKTDSDK